MNKFRRPNISNLILALAFAAAAGATWRQWYAAHTIENAVRAYRENQAIGDIMAGLQAAQARSAANGRPFIISGLLLYGAAASAPTDERETWLAMASSAFVEGLRREPLSDEALRGLAQTAHALDLGERARIFGAAAVERAPRKPVNHWVDARLQEPGSDARANRYRFVTQLRPALAGLIVAEARPHLSPEDVLAPTPEAWLAWAESVTDSVQRARIARHAQSFLAEGASGHIPGWLAYYAGLDLIETDPAAAVKLLASAVEHVPGEQAFHRNHGFALLMAGRVTEAETSLEQSIELYDDLDNAAYLGLAEARERLGKHEQALALFRRMSHNDRLEDWIQRRARAGIARIERAGNN